MRQADAGEEMECARSTLRGSVLFFSFALGSGPSVLPVALESVCSPVWHRPVAFARRQWREDRVRAQILFLLVSVLRVSMLFIS
jgi:hypothetical protein